MSNIRQVQWNAGAPESLQAGMVIEFLGKVRLVGNVSPEDYMNPSECCKWDDLSDITRWAWLIQPHELNWLEDMASRKTRTQE
ncbi:hypothetical protein I5G20_29980 [Pseudomonas aeruginosa]|nr:hypothetical protein [Pseudomonas aeruginosa]MBG7027429.1 hypothetical protein [Pseudomonas aeruginosa]MBG7370024.1 hypothetical protein [Pseudomonas aeruginosa]